MGCLICILVLVSTLFATEATDHMLIRDKARIDNVVFTCAILHNMLIENDKWEDEDDIDDVAADITFLNTAWMKESRHPMMLQRTFLNTA